MCAYVCVLNTGNIKKEESTQNSMNIFVQSFSVFHFLAELL